MGLILKAILTIMIIATIIFCVCWQFFIKNPGCDPENQIVLKGFFRGFKSNLSYDGCIDVFIGNSSYVFYHFDKNYMQNLIGYNISLSCCKRFEYFTTSIPSCYFDLIEAYITDKS